MKTLTRDEADAMDAVAMAIIEKVEEHNVTCLVIISGRGYERLAMSKENAADAALLLASAYASLCKHNAKEAN